MIDRFLALLARMLIHLYQVSWSHWTRPRCLFSPSCSQRAIQIFSEKGFLGGIRSVRKQLCDCRSEYSIRLDAADRPELVAASGRVFAWYELSDSVREPLTVNRLTERRHPSAIQPGNSSTSSGGQLAPRSVAWSTKPPR